MGQRCRAIVDPGELLDFFSKCSRQHKGSSFLYFCLCLGDVVEKAMAPHSSTLAWKIPWTEEPGRLQSMGSLRVGHD